MVSVMADWRAAGLEGPWSMTTTRSVAPLGIDSVSRPWPILAGFGAKGKGRFGFEVSGL